MFSMPSTSVLVQLSLPGFHLLYSLQGFFYVGLDEKDSRPHIPFTIIAKIRTGHESDVGFPDNGVQDEILIVEAVGDFNPEIGSRFGNIDGKSQFL